MLVCWCAGGCGVKDSGSWPEPGRGYLSHCICVACMMEVWWGLSGASVEHLVEFGA